MPTPHPTPTDPIHSLAAALHQQHLHSPSIMQTALSQLSDMTGAPHGWVLLFHDDGGVADAYASGDVSGTLTRVLWNKMLLQDLIDQIRAEGRLVLWGGLHTHERWAQMQIEGSLQLGSAAGMPLYVADQMIGVVILLHPEPECFDSGMSAHLEEAADVIANALANARQYEHLAAAYEAYTEDEQLRRDLTAMIYHDLRGPLQNILASVTRVERLLDGSAVGAHLMKLAGRSVRQMERMLKSLLDIERLEAQTIPIHLQPTSLQDVLLEAADLVHAMAQEADQALVLELEDKLPCVQADHDMMLRIVVNLLENAIKHTPEGGRISLRSVMGEHGVYISVHDTGSGIPNHMRGNIFDKFVRLKRDAGREGYGLGLAFCRLAVEAHGGRIWVDSDPQGGAVFAFVLPVAEVARAA